MSRIAFGLLALAWGWAVGWVAHADGSNLIVHAHAAKYCCSQVFEGFPLAVAPTTHTMYTGGGGATSAHKYSGWGVCVYYDGAKGVVGEVSYGYSDTYESGIRERPRHPIDCKEQSRGQFQIAGIELLLEAMPGWYTAGTLPDVPVMENPLEVPALGEWKAKQRWLEKQRFNRADVQFSMDPSTRMQATHRYIATAQSLVQQEAQVSGSMASAELSEPLVFAEFIRVLSMVQTSSFLSWTDPFRFRSCWRTGPFATTACTIALAIMVAKVAACTKGAYGSYAGIDCSFVIREPTRT